MKRVRLPFLWLAIGAVLMLFANGRWIIPVAAWFFPVFFLRFMRMQKPLKGFIWLVLATACTNAVAWWKMIPAPLPVYIMITCLGFQLWTLCFLADRLLATRL